ncbi:MAG: YggS family pyridoxal phosphate-dependent enzyme [Prevotellaceae bacterium]|nr:YggS family pyridoxal phosphate-dependent enzyme [Candidatus Minthosoma caballi]
MIAERLKEVNDTIRDGVKLVAVSKYHPVNELQEAYDAGQRVFGESHVQELVAKNELLPKDIEWHFIGHLQTNKVKYMAPFVSLIHSVDSMKLLKEIDKQAQKAGRVIDCLMQLHIADEETKFGFTPNELKALLSANDWRELKGIRIVGIMAMATNTDNDEQIGREFESVKILFDELKSSVFANEDSFKEISMGMSGDYQIAMQHGSTLVRVGSMIFGERDYSKPFTMN